MFRVQRYIKKVNRQKMSCNQFQDNVFNAARISESDSPFNNDNFYPENIFKITNAFHMKPPYYFKKEGAVS